MKKLLTGIILFTALMSCNSGESNKSNETENAMEETPKALDSTTQHPSGMTNSSVISTDTNAMDPVKMDTKEEGVNAGKEKK